jgi:hypothetical protein
MNVEGNRPGLQAAVLAELAPLTLERPHDVIIERARGRIWNRPARTRQGRILSISLVRIKGMKTLRETAEGIAAHRTRAFSLMTT